MKQTVGHVPLCKRASVSLQLRGDTRMRLERTKSVEAPKSRGHVSPLYRSLKNDANVRPEERRIRALDAGSSTRIVQT